jgi:hypothetical protein
MGAIISGLASWVLRALGVAVGSTLMATIGMLFSDVILNLLGQVVDLVSNAVSSTGIDLPSVNTSLAALPPEMLQVMKLIRLDDALAIIVTAVGVRGVGSMLSMLRSLRRGVGA